ncbi:MAG: bacteriohemerythrin [Candidatus Thiodiazotropha sp.]
MKVFLEWLDEWYLGVEAIDRQHVQLVGLLNNIAESMGDENTPGEDGEKVFGMVLHLHEETRQHFTDEEAVMRDHEYPELIEHHREHIMLLAELQEFIRDVEEGVRRFDYEALVSLKHWLINHVIDTDMAFARYLERSE